MTKILIIEDEEVLGDVLLEKLQIAGYQCELVRDGIRGFSKMVEWKPDLVLLDLFLPLLNGFEILKQKRNDSSIADIPVVVLTNSLHPTQGTEVQRLGVSGFMVKADVSPDEIISKIENIV